MLTAYKMWLPVRQQKVIDKEILKASFCNFLLQHCWSTVQPIYIYSLKVSSQSTMHSYGIVGSFRHTGFMAPYINKIYIFNHFIFAGNENNSIVSHYTVKTIVRSNLSSQNLTLIVSLILPLIYLKLLVPWVGTWLFDAWSDHICVDCESLNCLISTTCQVLETANIFTM